MKTRLIVFSTIACLMLIASDLNPVSAEQAPPVLQVEQGSAPPVPALGEGQTPLTPPGRPNETAAPPLCPRETPKPGPMPGGSPPAPLSQAQPHGLLMAGPRLEQGQMPAPLGDPARAIKTALNVKGYLVPGGVWMERRPGGEMVAKAALVYQGVAVGTLEFDPASGEILPCGYQPRTFRAAISTNAIKQELPSIIANLKVLNGAEYRDPERSWLIPLSYNSRIVAHMKVYYDGVHIVPDYPANQEMRVHGP